MGASRLHWIGHRVVITSLCPFSLSYIALRAAERPARASWGLSQRAAGAVDERKSPSLPFSLNNSPATDSALPDPRHGGCRPDRA